MVTTEVDELSRTGYKSQQSVDARRCVAQTRTTSRTARRGTNANDNAARRGQKSEQRSRESLIRSSFAFALRADTS